MTTIDVKKEQRGVMATQTAATAAAGAKTFTAEEKNACAIDAMLYGGTCETCQQTIFVRVSLARNAGVAN